jgi:hypothetical protein
MEEREVEEDEKGGEKCEWVLLEYCAAPSAFEEPQGQEREREREVQGKSQGARG